MVLIWLQFVKKKQIYILNIISEWTFLRNGNERFKSAYEFENALHFVLLK